MPAISRPTRPIGATAGMQCVETFRERKFRKRVAPGPREYPAGEVVVDSSAHSFEGGERVVLEVSGRQSCKTLRLRGEFRMLNIGR